MKMEQDAHAKIDQMNRESIEKTRRKVERAQWETEYRKKLT